MAKPLVSDELWAVVAPLLPPEPPKPKGGRPRVSDRAALTGIIFVLKSGIPWEMLPQEMGCGSGMTCSLAQAQGVARGGRMGATAQEALGPSRRSRADRLGAGVFGLGKRTPAPGGAKRPERIRRIRANRARSATLWSTEEVSRSR